MLLPLAGAHRFSTWAGSNRQHWKAVATPTTTPLRPSAPRGSFSASRLPLRNPGPFKGSELRVSVRPAGEFQCLPPCHIHGRLPDAKLRGCGLNSWLNKSLSAGTSATNGHLGIQCEPRILGIAWKSIQPHPEPSRPRCSHLECPGAQIPKPPLGLDTSKATWFDVTLAGTLAGIFGVL